MEKANAAIRQAAKEAGVKLWQVADAVGVNDGNLSRKLRHELPTAEQDRIIAIIAKLSKEGS